MRDDDATQELTAHIQRLAAERHGIRAILEEQNDHALLYRFSDGDLHAKQIVARTVAASFNGGLEELADMLVTEAWKIINSTPGKPADVA